MSGILNPILSRLISKYLIQAHQELSREGGPKGPLYRRQGWGTGTEEGPCAPKQCPWALAAPLCDLVGVAPVSQTGGQAAL